MLKVAANFSFSHHEFEIDFMLASGATLGLYGKSGIGKSTLLQAIAGLVAVKDLSISLDNVEWDKKGEILVPAKNRNIGFVFQDFALFPHLSVMENLKYSLRVPSQKLDEIINVLDIESILTKKANNISGGQQQRTAIGRALACDPQLLLMDEPFSALDKGIKNDVKNYLKSHIIKENKKTILISHDKNDLEFFTDNIIGINS